MFIVKGHRGHFRGGWAWEIESGAAGARNLFASVGARAFSIGGREHRRDSDRAGCRSESVRRGLRSGGSDILILGPLEGSKKAIPPRFVDVGGGGTMLGAPKRGNVRGDDCDRENLSGSENAAVVDQEDRLGH